ncbi:beta strand repeat-containing protein [Candidatus Omnitrophota bacterium]
MDSVYSGTSDSGSGVTALKDSDLLIIKDGNDVAMMTLDSSGDLTVEGEINATITGTSENANTLDNIDSSAFVRSDVSDSVTTGATLNIDSGAVLSIDDVGGWDIAGTAIAPDAAEINILDGGLSAAELDADLLTATEGDTAYVNVGSDTMTGTLTLSPASGDALVTTAGNVGIGTTGPGVNLDIHGTTATVRTARFTTTAGNTAAFIASKSNSDAVGTYTYLTDGDEIGSFFAAVAKETAGDFGGTGELLFFADGDHTSDTDLPTGMQIQLTPDGQAAREIVLTIKNDGNVGIGTTGPGAILHVLAGEGVQTVQIDRSTSAAYGSQLHFTSSDADGFAIGLNPSDDLYFDRNDGSWHPETMVIQRTTGNVGIGTTVPGALLDVQGAAQFGSGNVDLIDSTGKIAGISGTYFASLNGSALTDLTADMVGLGNVDNTADTAKPVSTAQQTALDLKANIASPTFTGTVGGVTATMVGLGNVNNTADTAKPVSTAQQTALDLKSNIASPTFTGSITMPGTGIWNSSGSVGIGTTSPDKELHIRANVQDVGPRLRLELDDTGNSVNADNIIGALEFEADDSQGSGVRAHIYAIGEGTSGETGLAFGTRGSGGTGTTAGVEAMRIDNSGLVGIGTTSPDSLLELSADGTTDLKMSSATIGTTKNRILFEKSGGTHASPTDVANGDDLGSLEARGYSGGSYFGMSGVLFEVDGTFTSGQIPPSRISFLTNPANTAQTEVMRIDKDGNVGIGTTVPDSYKLNVNGTINATQINVSDAQIDLDDIAAGSTNVHLTTTLKSNYDAASTHVSSTGADHSYIDQAVTTASSPSFTALTVSGGNIALSQAAATVDGVDLDTALTDVGVTASTGLSVSGTGHTRTLAGIDASTSVKGVASFDVNEFTVTTGAVSILADGIDDLHLDFGTTGNQISTADIPEQTNLYYTDARVNARIDANQTVAGDWEFSNALTVAAPTTDSHAATKLYVDQGIAGLSWKEAVIDDIQYVKTTANAPSGTATSGEKCLNSNENKIYAYTTSWDAGTSLTSGNRYVFSETGSDTTGNSGTYTKDNKIYEYNGTSTTGTASSDGDAVFIEEVDTGYVYTGTLWTPFTGASAYDWGTGLDSPNGNTVNVGAGTGITVTADDVGIDNEVVATLSDTQELTNKTLTSPNVNEAVALSATSTELNLLDGVTDITTQAELNTHAALTTTHGVSGDIVGTTDTQTLSNKIISAVANGLTVGTNQLVVSGGNVGIGTVNPSEAPLEVYDPSVSVNTMLYLNNPSAQDSVQGEAIHFEGWHSHAQIRAYFNPVIGQGGSLQLQTYNSGGTLNTGVLIDRTGNVGMGVTSPEEELHVRTADDSAAQIRVDAFDNDTATQPAQFGFYRGRGTAASPASLQSGDEIGNILFYGKGEDDWWAAAQILGVADAEWATASDTTDNPSRIIFKTTPDGAWEPIERVRIDKDGNVGIGTVAPGSLLSIYKDSPATNEDLFIVETDTAERFTVDEDGDVDLDGSLYMSGAQRISSGGSFNSKAGTLAWNAYYGNSDIDTGLWFPSAGNMGIVIDGTEAVRFVSGNVGIGDTTPADKLVVAGNIAVTGTVDTVDVAALYTDVKSNEDPGHTHTAYQPVDAGLTSIAGLTTAGDEIIYTTASDTYDTATLTAAGRAILLGVDAAAQRTTLGLGNVENTALSTWTGSSNITTIGILNPITVKGDLETATTGTLTVTNGSSSVTTSVDLTGHFNQDDAIKIVNSNPSESSIYTVSAINATTITLDSPYSGSNDSDGSVTAKKDSDLLLVKDGNDTTILTMDKSGGLTVQGALTVTGTISGAMSGTVETGETLNIDSGATLSIDGSWDIGGTVVTPTAAELNFVDGVTSAIQTQIDGKIAADDTLTGLVQSTASGASYITGGNVGIGTTVPDKLVNVVGGANAVLQVEEYNSADSMFRLAFQKAQGSVGSPNAVSTGFDIGQIQYEAHDGTSFVRAADMRVETEGTIATGQTPAHFLWRTMNTSGTIAERMRLSADGYVGIGTTDPGSRLSVDHVGAGDSYTWIEFTQSGGAASKLVGDSTTNALAIEKAAGGEIFNVRQDGGVLMGYSGTGSVGIGTLSPEAKLDVEGTLQVGTAGDTGIAHDLLMTNISSSAIKSYAPLTIQSGGSNDNLDLTLKGTGTGKVYVDDDLYVAGDFEMVDLQLSGGAILDTQDNTVNVTDSLAVSGNLQIAGAGPHYISAGNVGIGTTDPVANLEIQGTDGLLFSGSGLQSYLFKLHTNDEIGFSGQTSGSQVVYDYHTADGDGTDDLRFQFFGVGQLGSITNRERMVMMWDTSESMYQILTEKGGSGSQRPLVLEADGSGTFDQLYLATDGKVGIGTTVPTALLNVEGSAIFNDDSADVDFRIESNDAEKLFYLDGGNNSISFGSSGNVDSPFALEFPARTATAATSFYWMRANTGSGSVTIPTGTTADVVTLYLQEPNITATGTVTNASTLKISSVADEATNNYALWVDAGDTRFDGNVGIGVTTPGAALQIDGDLSFIGPQSISTTTGNLTVSVPAGDDVTLGDDVALIYADGGAHSGAGGIGLGTTLGAGSFVRIQHPALTSQASTNFFLMDTLSANAVTVPTGTTDVVGTLSLQALDITATGTVNNTATLYIKDAATEGEGASDYALWVDAGLSRFDNQVTIQSPSGAPESTALTIDQDTNNTGLYIDTEATSGSAIHIQGDTLTTINAILLDNANALTTGGLLKLVSGSTDVSTRDLAFIHNDNASATGTTALRLQQDSTGPALWVDAGKAIFDGYVGIGTAVPTNLLSFGGTDPTISTATSDGSDTNALVLSGGGEDGSTRGAGIYLYGNERAVAGYKGRLMLIAGDTYTSGSDGSIVFRTGTNQERMIVDYAGYVGIGTVAPEAKLDVEGTLQVGTPGDTGIAHDLHFLNATTAPTITSYKPLTIQSGNPNSNSDLTLKGTGTGKVYVDDDLYVAGDFEMVDLQLSGGAILDTQDNTVNVTDSLAVSGNLQIAGAGPHYISAGNVGIGTTDPAERLSVGSTSQFKVSSTGAVTAASLSTGSGTISGAGSFTTLSSTGVTTLGNNSATVAIDSSDWDISTTGALTGISGITNDGAYTQTGTSANTFTGASTFSNATYSALFTGGNVGIGVATPGAKLQIDGGLSFVGAETISTTAGALTLSGGNGDYVIAKGTSDTAGSFRIISNDTSVNSGLRMTINMYTSGTASPTFWEQSLSGFDYTSADPTTHSGVVYGLRLQGATLTGTNANQTVTTAKTLNVGEIAEGTNVDITNQYGIYVNDQNEGDNAYGIYVEGANTAAGYFGGNVGIGTVAPNTELQIHNATPSLRITDSGSAEQRLQFTDNDEYLGQIKVEDSVGMSISVAASGDADEESDLDDDIRVTIDRSGNVGIGTTNPTEKIEIDGSVKLTGRIRQGGLGDVAEMMMVSLNLSAMPEASYVVVIDKTGGIKLSDLANSTRVIGVVSTDPAQILMEDLADSVPVALSGTVPCKVTTENGPIYPGDLLTSSSKPGYAMKADQPKVGTIIGKAMEGLEEGEGTIMIFVTRQ